MEVPKNIRQIGKANALPCSNKYSIIDVKEMRDQGGLIWNFDVVI